MTRGWTHSFRVLMGFSFGAAPREATLFLLSGAFMSLLTPIAAFGSKLFIDALLTRDLERGLLVAGALAIIAAAGLVNTLYYVDFLFSVAEKAGAAVDRRLMRLMAGIAGIEHHERPDYLDRLDALREERFALAWITNATAGLLRVAVQAVGTGILLARLDPVLLLLPLAGVASFLLGRKAQTLRVTAVERTAEGERLRRHLFETATSVDVAKEIRVFGLAEDLVQKHHRAAESVMSVRNSADWLGAVLQMLDGLVTAGAYIAAIVLIWIRAARGEATPGDVVLAVGLAAGMTYMVTIAVNYGTSFIRVLRVAERYLWLERYAKGAQGSISTSAPVPSSIRQGIDLRNVTFQYPGMDRVILDTVSVRLPAGTVVALVGENGAGKTTLVKLLTRMYEPSSGTITVDGVPLRDLPLGEWRSHISTAFQDFVRFELLARETVGVGDLRQIADAPAVKEALARAGGTDLAERLPNGLDTQLGRAWDGVELSGGQWQKLALGRAMMREMPLLLIFDEPTASLDAQTEHELFERYADLAREAGTQRGTITLLISHRFSTVRMADLILVMRDGGISEMGTHHQLMDRGGLYAELYELQARAYR